MSRGLTNHTVRDVHKLAESMRRKGKGRRKKGRRERSAMIIHEYYTRTFMGTALQPLRQLRGTFRLKFIRQVRAAQTDRRAATHSGASLESVVTNH